MKVIGRRLGEQFWGRVGVRTQQRRQQTSSMTKEVGNLKDHQGDREEQTRQARCCR